ncbi:hypothetical protein L535_2422, partial [Bordetella bronchiseptica SBL-F6116]
RAGAWIIEDDYDSEFRHQGEPIAGWIDAGENGGLVQRYEVFHLPALFVTRDGAYYGPVSAQLADWDLRQQISLALDSYPAELP